MRLSLERSNNPSVANYPQLCLIKHYYNKTLLTTFILFSSGKIFCNFVNSTLNYTYDSN